MQGPGSRALDLGIQVPGSGIMLPGSLLKDPGSRPWILDAGSKTLDPSIIWNPSIREILADCSRDGLMGNIGTHDKQNTWRRMKVRVLSLVRAGAYGTTLGRPDWGGLYFV